MFFIVFGDCLIHSRDVNYKPQEKKKVLMKSDLFGEIGLLYNTPRTCSIMSSNYSILARLTKPRLRSLISDYPIFLDRLKKQVYNYDDYYKVFMNQVLNQLDVLKNLKYETFHKVLYRFKEIVIDSNETLLSIGDRCNYLIIVKKGELEAFVTIDRTTFVLEKLRPGSILNYRNFFFNNEKMQVNVRSTVETTTVMILSKDNMDYLTANYPEIEHRVLA